MGSWLCAFPVADVVETMRPLALHPIAAAPSFVRGLAIVRDLPVPVVDAGALLGARDQPPATRFVVLRVGDRRVAVAVGSVLGIRALPRQVLHELPPLLRDASAEVIGALGALDAELFIVFRAARLISGAMWKALAAEEVAA